MSVKRNIRIVVSVVLLGLLLVWVDLDAVGRTWAASNLPLLAVALLIASFNRVFMALKWNLLLRARDIRVGWGEATRVYYTSSFMGIFLPPTVGGDVVRAYMLGKRHGVVAEVVASILVERLLGLFALLLFGGVACLLCVRMFTGLSENARDIFWVTSILIVAGGVGFTLSLNRRVGAAIAAGLSRLQGRRFLSRPAAKLARLYQAYGEYRQHPVALAAFFALTLIENTLPIVRTWVVAIAMGLEVSPLAFLVIVPIELLIIRIPISFDGFGLREGTFVFFLAQLGVDEGVAFSVGLANHLLFLVALIPGGLFYMTGGEAVRHPARPPDVPEPSGDG